ncbi:MAG: hypothetical protein PF517_10810 [Salinivirgaceae bacterium]|jgi:hypothetical protein|nr:hypothetical protein [Salinivirgaceae bacterium]
MKNEKYLGRGIHNEQFIKALMSGNLKPMLEVINTDKHSDLDVQIRNNYLNIYYAGGNIARVSSENSIDFDKFYFCLEKDKSRNEILKDQALMDNLKLKRDLLIGKFRNGDYNEYFLEAKKVMDAWLSEYQKPERKEQHQLSIENRYGHSDYSIIDLKYQVSTESAFACKLLNVKGKAKKPRFDIIAVDKAGKLCVIEFKKGTGAIAGVSGLKEHYECYNNSIGLNYKPFVDEMKNLLKQKQALNLIDKQVEIIAPLPEFMFAFSYATNHKIREDRIFDREYKKLNAAIHVIKLKEGSVKLLG